MFGYRDAVAVLGEALTFGIRPSLDSITKLCEVLGRPQDAFRVVQVTGTNGKSSVVRMTAAILFGQGVSVGCYTSPHLDEYLERIEIDGKPISEEAFALAIRTVSDAAEAAGLDEPTEFELLTAAALWSFSEAGVDVAVLEVGMGGRWDATSVTTPDVAVVTGVGLDHTAHLGTSHEAIATDKAHIIKEGSVPILGPGTKGVDDVFLARAERMNRSGDPAVNQPIAVREAGDSTPAVEDRTVRFEIRRYPSGPEDTTRARIEAVHSAYEIDVPAPVYQVANAAMAVAVSESLLGHALRVEELAASMAETCFPARFEVISQSPLVIADGSHNPQAAAVLTRSLEQLLEGCRPAIVLGVLRDKDAAGIVAELAKVAGSWFLTQPASERAMTADELAAVVREVTDVDPVLLQDVESALQGAIDSEPCAIVVTGSLVTAAQVRRKLLGT